MFFYTHTKRQTLDICALPLRNTLFSHNYSCRLTLRPWVETEHFRCVTAEMFHYHWVTCKILLFDNQSSTNKNT